MKTCPEVCEFKTFGGWCGLSACIRRGTTTKIMPNRVVVYPNDYVNVVRCAYCKHCYDMGSDPMEPYDGESEWYCARFDRDTSAYEIDPYRFYCADGERRESE